jgi:hypothetical protein
MRILKYNPNHVPPSWFGMTVGGVNEISIRVSQEDYECCQEVIEHYPIVPLEEFAALIEYTRLSWEGIQAVRNRSDLVKQLEAGKKMEEVQVKIGRRLHRITDKTIIDLIDRKYNSRPTKDLFNKLIAELWTYFDYSVGLTKYQVPVLIGYLCAYCGVYKFEDTRLQTRTEFDNNPATNPPTYKAYLKNNVMSWMQSINKAAGIQE